MAVNSLVISNVSHTASANPGLVWSPSEGGHVYFEDRETAGTLYRVQNATFDGTHWSVNDSSKPAFAFALNDDGAIIYLAPPSSSPWTTWEVTGKHGIFDIRDFGATGNGTTDDYSAIQAAADAAGDEGGGTVYAPPGVYLISKKILLSDNTTLEGSNSGNTTFLAKDGINGGHSNIMVANTEFMDSPPGETWQQNIAVRYINFDNNAGDQNSSGNDAAVFFQGVKNVTIEQCTIINCNNHGISVVSVPALGAPTQGNVRILNNIIDILPIRQFNPATGKDELVSGNFPIRVESLDGVLIDGNIIGFNGRSTWKPTWSNDAIDAPGCDNVIVTNNMVTWCTDGIGVNTANNAVISDNIVINCIGFGISSFNSTGIAGVNRFLVCNNLVVAVQPNQIDSTLGPTPTGIRVITGATDATVANNVLFGPFGANGISLETNQGTCNDNLIDLQGTESSIASNGISVKGSGWTINGNTIRDGVGTTAAAINIATSGLSGLVICENNITNVVTPFLASALPTGSRISGNLGINPPSATSITQPTVTGVITNPFPYDCMVYIKGGVVLDISVNGLSIGLTPPVGVRVPVSAKLNVTYTSVPSWVWIPE